MRRTFGTAVVGALVLAGVVFGGGGSAQAFCPPGGSGLDGLPNPGSNFPALEEAGFDSDQKGPWNATFKGASGDSSAVEAICGDESGNAHAADPTPGPHPPLD